VGHPRRRVAAVSQGAMPRRVEAAGANAKQGGPALGILNGDSTQQRPTVVNLCSGWRWHGGRRWQFRA
jgi:hypothetical protein